MSYLQTNIGDLKNELKKLQETTNAQIERLQNLLQSRQQMQEGLVKIQGAIEVLSAMLEEEKDGKEK